MKRLFPLLALTACASVSSSSGTEGRSDIHGRYIDRFYTAGGPVDRPTDLSGYTFDVFIDGTLFAQAGGAADGMIHFADVPNGPYVLRLSRPNNLPFYQQREAHELEVVSSHVGRPDAVGATSVPLQLQLDGLASWGDGDWLVADCFENGTEHYPITLAPPLAVGATRVDATFDWAVSDWGPYLLDAAAGDRLTISRYVHEPRTDVAITKLSQVAAGPAPSQRDTEPSSFAANFVDVLADQSVTVDVDVDSLAAAVPSAQRYWGTSLLKGPASHAFSSFGPALITISPLPDHQWTGQITATGIFGDPFDPTWQTIVHSTYGMFDTITLPDGTMTQTRMHAYDMRYLDRNEYVVEAAQQAARSATLNGYPIPGDIPWDGTSPITLRIDVPAGSVGFSAWLNLVSANRAILSSDRNEITLPAEAVRLGATYLLDVHVGTRSETAATGAFSTVGPFRLVRP